MVYRLVYGVQASVWCTGSGADTGFQTRGGS